MSGNNNQYVYMRGDVELRSSRLTHAQEGTRSVDGGDVFSVTIHGDLIDRCFPPGVKEPHDVREEQYPQAAPVQSM